MLWTIGLSSRWHILGVSYIFWIFTTILDGKGWGRGIVEILIFSCCTMQFLGLCFEVKKNHPTFYRITFLWFFLSLSLLRLIKSSAWSTMSTFFFLFLCVEIFSWLILCMQVNIRTCYLHAHSGVDSWKHVCELLFKQNWITVYSKPTPLWTLRELAM